MRALLTLRGNISSRAKLALGVAGAVVILGSWYALLGMNLIHPGIFPLPHKVLSAIPEMHFEDALVRNVFYSIKLNLIGYAEAVALAIPLGLLIGLVPLCRGVTEPYIAATRYLPLNVLIGLFIAIFGIGSEMKVQFLACAIFVYLLPVIIQRVDETPQVHIDTAKTLGASPWQIIRHVFLPEVLSRASDDIRVLVAISWTYITLTEVINSSDGGIGALAYLSARQSRPDKMLAVILIVILIGFIQDRLFRFVDKHLLKHKHV